LIFFIINNVSYKPPERKNPESNLEKVVCHFFFGELTETGDISLTMMENTALCHIPVETIF